MSDTDAGQGAASDAPVTLVIQTRVAPQNEAVFAAWQEGTNAVLARTRGFLANTIIPPSPPAQHDWVILQRFASADLAVRWLNSSERLARLEEIQPFLVGRDDVHIVKDGAPGVLPAPVSAVISTRIKLGQEPAYRQWEQKIAVAQSKAPGFQGYRFEPPIPGVQEDWLSVLRFDTEAHLQAWLDSPERAALLKEAESFTEEFHARIARSGFDQWFATPAAAAQAPPTWKQNMLVLLMLYPVVFLFGLLVQTPLLMGWAGIGFSTALFIGNVASVLLLNSLVPWVSGRFGWWLKPAGQSNRALDLKGGVLILALYGAMLVVFAFL